MVTIDQELVLSCGAAMIPHALLGVDSKSRPISPVEGSELDGGVDEVVVVTGGVLVAVDVVVVVQVYVAYAVQSSRQHNARRRDYSSPREALRE